MRFVGRRAGDEEASVRAPYPLSVERGGWYADPFERAGERWWDGRGWTDRVREAPDPDEPSRARDVRIAGSAGISAGPAPVQPTTTNLPPTFAPMEVAVGQMARLIPAEPQPSGGRWASIAHGQHSYELLAINGRIAALHLGGRSEPARMACAQGGWCLRKRRLLGSELVIESSDGRQRGSYSGQAWPEGTISLTDGSEFEVRRVLNRGWRVRGSDPELLVEIRHSGLSSVHRMGVTVRALAEDSSSAQVALLTACAVLRLESVGLE